MSSQHFILIAQANNTLEILENNYLFYKDFSNIQFKKLGKDTAAAMVFSQIFIDYYTCAETFLFRVSQMFENNLEHEKWHKSLLYKMSLNIPEIRPAVLSKSTYDLLDELLRFRHFKRYYFSFNYDWDKIELIEKKYVKVHPMLNEDIMRFISFLKQL